MRRERATTNSSRRGVPLTFVLRARGDVGDVGPRPVAHIKSPPTRFVVVTRARVESPAMSASFTTRLLSGRFLLLAARARLAQRGSAEAATPPTPVRSARCAGAASGPARGGRSIAVAGSDARPNEYYMGATGGGLWKTTDGGTTWKPVTDGQITSSSVGAVAVCAVESRRRLHRHAASPTSAATSSRATAPTRSTDGGKTWTHIGLDRHAGHREDPRASRPTRDIVLRRGVRPSRGAEPGARRLPDRRTAARRGTRSCSATTRPAPIDLIIDPNEPAGDLRRAVGGVPQRRGDVERRPGQRPLQVDRRRRSLDRDHRAIPGCRRACSGKIGLSVSRRRLAIASTR